MPVLQAMCYGTMMTAEFPTGFELNTSTTNYANLVVYYNQTAGDSENGPQRYQRITTLLNMAVGWCRRWPSWTTVLVHVQPYHTPRCTSASTRFIWVVVEVEGVEVEGAWPAGRWQLPSACGS